MRTNQKHSYHHRKRQESRRMADKEGATNPVTYEEFEPCGKWQRGEDCDILTLELPDFKKEQLRVHIVSRSRILKVSGERPLGASKNSKFYRELKLARNYDTGRIAARFADNKLQITLPKRAANQVPQEQNEPQQVAAKDGAKPPTPMGNGVTKRGKKLAKIALNVAMVLILLAAMVAFVLYMHRATLLEDQATFLLEDQLYDMIV